MDLREAQEKYGDPDPSGLRYRVFDTAVNVAEATEEELRMILMLIDDDGLRKHSVTAESMKSLLRWADGEDVPPWSAGYLINWLLLRRRGG